MSKEFFRESIEIHEFVQPKTVSRFIGIRGSALNSFEKAFNVKAVVVTNKGNISLRCNGEKDNVEKSIFKFYETIANLEDSLQTYEMDVPNDKVGFLIGSHGWSMNEIMRLSGAKVFCKQTEDNTSVAVIEGSHSKIQLAVELVLKRLERYSCLNQEKEDSYTTNLSRRIASGEETY
ncbi:unnamed protein product [Auanema sp. JU1783]|nr:unnamed protein product [Auanema sp. JU1783]